MHSKGKVHFYGMKVVQDRADALMNAAEGLSIEKAIQALKTFKNLPDTANILKAANDSGLPADEIVKYLKHGPEMEGFIEQVKWCIDSELGIDMGDLSDLLTKLDKEGA